MPNYLQHHGILGQKWGVRRFQNADGSYTANGLARRKLTGGKNKNKPNGPDIRIETRKSHRSDTLKRARKENINSLSDDELRKYNKRLQLEQDFERLREDNYSRAQSYIVKTLSAAAVSAAAAYMAPKIMDNGSEFVNSLLYRRRYITL